MHFTGNCGTALAVNDQEATDDTAVSPLSLCHWWSWKMCRMKADGESRKTAFEKPVGEEIACSSYQHRRWAQLACNSYLENVSSSGGNLHRISFSGPSLCDKC